MKVCLLGRLQEDDSISMLQYRKALENNLSCEVKIFEPNVVKFLPFKFARMIHRYILYPLQARKVKADVYHIIDHSYGHLVFTLPRQKTVVTCHDLIPIKYPQVTKWFTRILFFFSIKGMSKARKIVAVSESTKKDIEKALGNQNVSVVYNGLNWKPNKRKVQKKPTILSIGSSYYKNIPRVLKAAKYLKNKGFRFTLVRVGRKTKTEEELIKKLGIEQIVKHEGFASDEKVKELYASSDILLFPSIYEGFGWPPLEAMASGCAVIAGNTSSLPEVVGDAGILVNPQSQQEINKATEELVENSKLRKQMVLKGEKRAKKFTWNRSIKKLEKIYCEVAQ